METDFTIDVAPLAPNGGDHVNAKIIGPSGKNVPVELVDNEDGTYQAKYVPYEKGNYRLISNCSKINELNLISISWL